MNKKSVNIQGIEFNNKSILQIQAKSFNKNTGSTIYTKTKD